MLELDSEPSRALRYSSIYFLLAPWRKPEVSYKRWSVHPSCRHLSEHFHRVSLLVFSKLWYGVRGSCEVVRDKATLLKQLFLLPDLEK